MIFKWISLILFLIVIYLLRPYWLPVLNNFFTTKKSNNKIEHIKYDSNLNKEFNWTNSKQLMPFIGALDYQTSRSFYSEIGFKVEKGNKHCKVIINEQLSFWLQNYANKEWLDNSMMFLDVPDLAHLKNKLNSLKIEDKYKNVKISETKNYEWGDEFFMHR